MRIQKHRMTTFPAKWANEQQGEGWAPTSYRLYQKKKAWLFKSLVKENMELMRVCWRTSWIQQPARYAFNLIISYVYIPFEDQAQL